MYLFNFKFTKRVVTKKGLPRSIPGISNDTIESANNMIENAMESMENKQNKYNKYNDKFRFQFGKYGSKNGINAARKKYLWNNKTVPYNTGKSWIEKYNAKVHELGTFIYIFNVT